MVSRCFKCDQVKKSLIKGHRVLLMDLELEFIIGLPTRHHRVENKPKVMKIGEEMSEI